MQPARTYHSGRRSDATQAQSLYGALENRELGHAEGPPQGQLVPVAWVKRPEWKCELPTTEVARGLSDLADKAAGEALTTVKQEVQEKEEKTGEDVDRGEGVHSVRRAHWVCGRSPQEREQEDGGLSPRFRHAAAP